MIVYANSYDGAVKIFNNTFLGGSGAQNIRLNVNDIVGHTSFDIRNNLFTGNSPAIYFVQVSGIGTLTSNHNLGYNLGASPFGYNDSPMSLATWKTTTSQDADFLTTDPLLNGSYIQQVGSAAIDVGVSLTSYFTTDKAGSARPQGAAWDIGAYEWTVGVPVLTTPIDNAVAGWPVDFNWTGLTGATMYHIQVDNDIAFGSPEIDNDAVDDVSYCDVDDDCHYLVEYGEGLNPGTHYYWRVRALR
jgi:hypothetical protein